LANRAIDNDRDDDQVKLAGTLRRSVFAISRKRSQAHDSAGIKGIFLGKIAADLFRRSF
jgi:hypothetical protein